jgi:hypothetical protein
MDSELSVGHLVRVVGGDSFVLATYRVHEGLVGGLRVQGDMVFGQVLDLKTHRVRLQLVPPFEGRCSCPDGGACLHVAALGLAYLYQQPGAASDEELAYHHVESLDERGLRGLVMELLASFQGAQSLTADFLLRHELTSLGWNPDFAEADSRKVLERFRTVLDGDLSDPERLSVADRKVRTLLKVAAANGCPEFRMIALAGFAAELGAALDRLRPVAYRWRVSFHQTLEQVVQLMAKRSWPDQEEVACLRQLLHAYAVAGDFTARHLKAALLTAAHTPVLRDWVKGECKKGWRTAQGTPRKRLRTLIQEISGGVTAPGVKTNDGTRPACHKRSS